MRKKLATQVPIAELKANAGSYIGKVFELRGTLMGSLTSGGACNIILSTGGSPGHDTISYSVASDASPAQTGTRLACLVKVGEGSTYSLSDLRLVACTYLIDLERLEPAPKPATSELAAKAATPTSRGSARPTTRISLEQFVGAYTKAIRNFNPRLTSSEADTISRSIIGFSLRYQIDPRLVCAVILAESHFRIGATSHSGAQGLGQLMPSTAAGLGVNDAYDPVQNIYGSVRYVKGMLDRMSGNKDFNELTWYDLALALAAYNAGPNAVKKHGGVPPFRETQNYVRRVTSIYKQLCGVK